MPAGPHSGGHRHSAPCWHGAVDSLGRGQRPRHGRCHPLRTMPGSPRPPRIGVRTGKGRAGESRFTMTDPLSTWTDGAVKDAILGYVDAACTEGTEEWVPRVERIAVFDNDGTLWC